MKQVEQSQPFAKKQMVHPGDLPLSRLIPSRACLCAAVVLMATSAPSILAEVPARPFVTAPETARHLHPQMDAGAHTARAMSREAVYGFELERAVTRAATRHRLHPALLFAVMKAESSFNPLVVSRAGAVGLMQLVPETAMRHGVRNLYDTEENVAGGARHLRYLLDRFHGNIRLALAAYNAGERKVDRYRTIPPYKETRLYVRKVLGYYRDYRKGDWPSSLGQRTREPRLL